MRLTEIFQNVRQKRNIRITDNNAVELNHSSGKFGVYQQEILNMSTF